MLLLLRQIFIFTVSAAPTNAQVVPTIIKINLNNKLQNERGFYKPATGNKRYRYTPLCVTIAGMGNAANQLDLAAFTVASRFLLPLFLPPPRLRGMPKR